MKTSVLIESDKAAAKAEKVRGANDKSPKKILKVAAGAERRGDFQQLVKFLSLRLGRGIQLGVRDRDRAKAGQRRHQRFFLRREHAFRPRINKDGALRPGSAERRRDHHSGRNQAAQRMCVGAERKSNRLSGADRALRQIGGKANHLPVMAGAHGIGQLRTLGRYGAQLEGTFAAQQNTYQTGSQKQAHAIG